ncbi:hypothetical protein GHK92_18550 [Nocardioides sp. dk4132]|uniref:hypothetical protein n=1 Tax=unclassified Nocardioides TaxID=2615069 RepID=UPI00129556A6|nr:MULTISPECIES: hypothetical protein [unclassified Nocardioides]MQW77876.1 hypothetical protein [Nocardioides sp. dk4132]QGA08264.1 hypothetical protein GFH29_13255 [Nocardioides sp. dk884]
MSKLWQVLLGLGLVLPLGGYVAGSLAATSAEDPAPRPPIVLETTSSDGRPVPGTTFSPAPGTGEREDPEDDIEVVVPQPGEVGPDDTDDTDDTEDTDDADDLDEADDLDDRDGDDDD